MKCPGCGTEDNTPDHIFCWACGWQLRQSDPSMLDPQAFVQTILSRPTTEVVDLDSLYQEGLWLLARDFIEEALERFQKILDREPGFESGSLASRVKELRGKLNLRKKSLFRRAEQAYDNDNWDQVIAAMEAVLVLDDKHRRASRWLRTARKNKQYAWLYQSADKAIKDGDLRTAKNLLRELWNHAPYYGDPENLGREARIQPPWLFSRLGFLVLGLLLLSCAALLGAGFRFIGPPQGVYLILIGVGMLAVCIILIFYYCPDWLLRE